VICWENKIPQAGSAKGGIAFAATRQVAHIAASYQLD